METNIDYKALYEDARERAKQVKLTDTKENVAAAEYIFPELRENEDERIRRSLVRFLTGMKDISESGRTSCAVRKEDAEMFTVFLKYLEKQKEHTDGDFARGYDSGYAHCWSMAEKQDYSGLTDFERAIHRGFLCAGVENVPVTIIKETAQDCLAHLPAEWSEEDDVMFKTAKKIIWESEASDGTTNKVISWLENRFKSLRPSWKPSEEQMEALKEVINKVKQGIRPYESEVDHLESLYEQLKKLM